MRAPLLWLGFFLFIALGGCSQQPSIYETTDPLVQKDLGAAGTSKDLRKYVERIQQVEQLTGTKPREIVKLTLKAREILLAHSQVISSLQIMSAVVLLSHNQAPPGRETREWDYATAAHYYVQTLLPDATIPPLIVDTP